MASILLTGMTSPQTSSKTNERALSFAGLLNKVLRDAGHSVMWTSPDVLWTTDFLDGFDAVLVGVSPLTSLAANRAYGALSVIDLMHRSPKLSLFLDAPEPSLVTVSLRAMLNNPANLTKSLYALRKQFAEVKDTQHEQRCLSAIKALYSGAGLRLLLPVLPWRGASAHLSALPEAYAENIHSVNLDAHLISDDVRGGVTTRQAQWVTNLPKSSWVTKTQPGLACAVSCLPSGRDRSDRETSLLISQSTGILISPHKRSGTWWSPLYAQALSTNTPVITEWRESAVIGESWNFLAATLEELSQDERHEIALAQRREYLAHIPTSDIATELLEAAILPKGIKNK